MCMPVYVWRCRWIRGFQMWLKLPCDCPAIISCYVLSCFTEYSWPLRYLSDLKFYFLTMWTGALDGGNIGTTNVCGSARRLTWMYAPKSGADWLVSTNVRGTPCMCEALTCGLPVSPSTLAHFHIMSPSPLQSVSVTLNTSPTPTTMPARVASVCSLSHRLSSLSSLAPRPFQRHKKARLPQCRRQHT